MEPNHEYTDQELETVLQSIIASQPASRNAFDDARRVACGDLGINQPPNNLLSRAYQKLVENGRVAKDEQLERFMTKADVRNISGIAVITSLIKPYLCPGKCVYCPTEARMPKSYIASEPAAARALRLDFSPYEQMKQRIEMLERNGHSCDKIEYIIKGGTWNAYPLKYQYWFILESFRAANDLTRSVLSPHRGETEKGLAVGPTTEEECNSLTIEQLQQSLEIEQIFNETASHRIIGLTLETRPDAIAPKTILHMRKQGCTRIELGLQAPDDAILALIKRGHTTEQFRKAMHLLRDVGFKVDLHFMPDLPGTTPEHDIEMYASLFTDEGLRPDMVKIYPNTVIKSAELYQWFLDGRYKPYGVEGLFRALLAMKLATPRWCRISRLIRDIPEQEIEAGNKITNLREALSAELKKRGQKCVCLRCREIGRQMQNVAQYCHPERSETRNSALNGAEGSLSYTQPSQNEVNQAEDVIKRNPSTSLRSTRDDNGIEPQLFIEHYETRGGTEYFLSFEDEKRIAVYGFLRLRLPIRHCEPSQAKQSTTLSHTNDADAGLLRSRELPRNDVLQYFPELIDCAFIRELHVYGKLVKIGERAELSTQHTGLGKKLMAEAERIAKQNNYGKVAVISGVGVRKYYEKLGYKKEGTYMIKNLG